MKRRSIFLFAFLFLLQATAFAHAVGPASFDELNQWWVFEPGVVLPLALSALAYGIGWVRLRRRNSRGFGSTEPLCFLAGWITLLLALVSPLHPWGAVLFSAHMTQHELLMLVTAPLLVLGRPVVPFLWSLPKDGATALARWSKSGWWQRTWKTVTIPFVAWLVHAVVLWTWHLPALFQATRDSEWVHALQHASFLGSALLFWWSILHGRERAAGFGLAVLYMFTTALHSGLLGALLTFAQQIWYPIYDQTTASWGLTPLEDQQLGGLIMWIPAGLVYIVAGLAFFAGWLKESDRKRAGSSLPRAVEAGV